jgi:hypothetical protein
MWFQNVFDRSERGKITNPPWLNKGDGIRLAFIAEDASISVKIS